MMNKKLTIKANACELFINKYNNKKYSFTLQYITNKQYNAIIL